MTPKTALISTQRRMQDILWGEKVELNASSQIEDQLEDALDLELWDTVWKSVNNINWFCLYSPIDGQINQ